MLAPDTPNDGQLADMSAAQSRLIQLLVEAVAERLVRSNRTLNTTTNNNRKQADGQGNGRRS